MCDHSLNENWPQGLAIFKHQVSMEHIPLYGSSPTSHVLCASDPFHSLASVIGLSISASMIKSQTGPRRGQPMPVLSHRTEIMVCLVPFVGLGGLVCLSCLLVVRRHIQNQCMVLFAWAQEKPSPLNGKDPDATPLLDTPHGSGRLPR